MSQTPKRPEDEPQLKLIDVDLEKTIIGSCLLKPDLLLGVDLETSDFYAQAHRYIWTALVGLAADGEPVDTTHLAARMADLGTLASVGGLSYLTELTDGTIPVPPLPTARLRRLAIERRLQAAMVAAAGKMGSGDVSRELERVARAVEALDEHTRGGPKPLELSDVADDIEGLVFDGRRLLTGIATLDECTRGGIPAGSFVVLAGSPGAAKTTFSTWLADTFERQGAEVVYLAADESKASILVRLGQLAGFPREGLESPHVVARQAVASKWRGKRRIHVEDPPMTGRTLEEYGRALERVAGDRLRVLIVDSLQTCPCAAAFGELTEYARTNAAIDACKSIARTGTVVVAISEMSRAGYRENGDETSPLSSAKGSGSIEYGAALFIALKPVHEAPGAVDFKVAKSRLGNVRPTFRLKIDGERAAFCETDLPDREVERRAAENARDEQDRLLVLATIAKNPTLSSANAVWKATGLNKSKVLAAVRALLESGRMALVDGAYRPAVPANPNNNGDLC